MSLVWSPAHPALRVWPLGFSQIPWLFSRAPILRGIPHSGPACLAHPQLQASAQTSLPRVASPHRIPFLSVIHFHNNQCCFLVARVCLLSVCSKVRSLPKDVEFNPVLPAQGTHLALSVCIVECLPAPGFP